MRFDLNKLFAQRERTADGKAFSSWDVISDNVREVRTVAPDGSTHTEYRQWKPTKRYRRSLAGGCGICGAMTRKGTPCKRRAIPGRKRCRNHGGLSTGPRTPEGRARIAESNRRRADIQTTNAS